MVNRTLLLACVASGLVACAKKPAPTTNPESGHSIRVSTAVSSFNPTLKKVAALRVETPWKCDLSVGLHDAHGFRVRKLWEGRHEGKSSLDLTWDGKDDSGEVVPDEAYYVKAVAVRDGDTMSYDPPAFSGGRTFTVPGPQIDFVNGTLSYTLDQDARIFVRAGEKKGLLVKNIAHSAPRTQGQITEYWNGRDADNLVSVKDMPSWALMVSGYTLPENSIVAYGNKRIGYREYILGRFPRETGAMEFPNSSPSFVAAAGKRGNVNMHFFHPLLRDYPPRVTIGFPNSNARTEDGTIILQGTQRVLVDIDSADRVFNRNQQFELSFFIDSKFTAEDEIGYAPYNWIWNVADVPEGEHIVTVNLASFRDQIGTKSVKVLVKHR